MSDLLNYDEGQCKELFDKLSRTNSSRQIEPLDQKDYLRYSHREYHDTYNLIIGDVAIMVPPEFIYVSSESFSQSIQTLRQENSQKQKTGYHKRIIQIDLVFNGMDEINGYKVPAPTHYDGKQETNYYYVDGLRTLLAQFKCTPFLPIENELLNSAYKIYTVALQSIVISTIDGFQNALTAHLTLQEVDMMPYIEMPNIIFKDVIDWDLFRFYTQSFLTENYVYKNLQSLPINKDHTAFKIKILNENVLQSVKDTNSSSKEETVLSMVVNDQNYKCLIDSNESDVHISSFQCSYANMLTSIQMSDSSTPTLQYLGGMDTQFGITFETTDVNVIGAIEQTQILNDLMVRNNPKIRGSIGFVKLEADFITFCGSLFCTIESVETHTVQGIPGLYEVRLLCVSYDIAQSRRENLNGFLPFDGYESSADDLNKTGKELDIAIEDNKKQVIEQSYNGIQTKIYQDNYAEWKLRTTMEVYPDLRLPTYNETNQIIKNIIKFRKQNGLSKLPYESYPLQPSNIGFGTNVKNDNIPNEWLDNGGNNIYKDGNVPDAIVYDGFVDPDFYVFYPNTSKSLYDEEQAEANNIKQSTGQESTSIYTKQIPYQNVSYKRKNTYKPTYGNGESEDTSTTGFINKLKEFIGCHYSSNAEGEINDYAGPMFDDLGLITYGLKQLGILPDNFQRLKAKDFGSLDIFKSIPANNLKRGDIVLDSAKTMFSVCTGVDSKKQTSVITVVNPDGVIEEPLFYEPGLAFEIIPLQRGSKMIGTSQSNPYITDGDHYPDENKKVKKKKTKEIDTVEGYTSDNPYGDDNGASRGYTTLGAASQTTNSSNYDGITNVGSSAEKTGRAKIIWDFLKSKGLSDAGCAAILGNWEQESESFDSTIVQGGSHANAPISGKGYGIAQWTYPTRQAELVSWCKQNGLSCNTLEGQLNFFWYELNKPGYSDTIQYLKSNNVNNACYQFQAIYEKAGTPEMENRLNYSNGWYKEFQGSESNTSTSDFNNSSSSTSSSSSNEDVIVSVEQIKLNEIDRRNRAATGDELAEITEETKLNQADISGLTLPEIEPDGSPYTDGSVNITEWKDMTCDEFEALALTVATECEGETLACKMAMTQFLYDSSQKHYKGQGITAITKNSFFKSDKSHVESNDMQEAQQCVQQVFQNGTRWKKDSQVLAFTSMSNSNFASQYRNQKYSEIGNVNQHTFFGYNEPSDAVGYKITGHGVSKSSSNTVTIEETKTVKAKNLKNDAFGKPIYIKTDHFDTHDDNVGKEWQALNNDENRLNTAFVDEGQYSAKGRLVKAFPTFLFCILDDQSQWYDGRKLWTNYYTYKPVIDIQYHAANDMPTETAQIVVTNTYHNLDRSDNSVLNYSLSNDEEYDDNILDNTITSGIRTGATIAGGIIGYSLAKNYHTSINRWLYKNTGMMVGGIKITDRLIQMHSILFNHTKVREGARVHLRIGYGSDPLSLAPIINGTISAMTLGDQISITITSDGHELIQAVTSDKAKDVNNGALGLFGLGATQEAGNIISGILVKRESWINHLWLMGNAKNWFEGSKYHIEHFGIYINSGDEYTLQGGIDTGIYEQYDLLMNIYNASVDDGWSKRFQHWGYFYDTSSIIRGKDGEANIVFNKYNMTPWDVFQLCAQTMPEFIVKAEKYQFDSRVFYGLPFDLIKYRYDIIDGTIYQECKSNTQVHYIDTISSIIENQLSVTSRPSFTNAKVIYTRGNTPKSTAVIHSDDTIDNSKQKTKIIDSCIVQDYLGPDAAYEFTHLAEQGKKAARRIGISNLLYGWQQQYQGQILCLGAPQIKPDDYLMVNDFYTSLNGLCLVREVIHSFSTSTGFTTSIVPGIIGISPEQNSGNVTMLSNLLTLFSGFTKCSTDRKLIKEQCERYADILAVLNQSVNMFNNRGFGYGDSLLGEAGNFVSGTAKNVLISKQIYNTVRCIKKSGGLLNAIKAVTATFNATKTAAESVGFGKSVMTAIRITSAVNNVARGFEATKGTVMTIGAAAGAQTLGISLAVSLLISFTIDAIANTIQSWLENRNVCCLLPLWWEGKPFISGIKDGEKILLIKDENNGSNENDESEGIETDADEISVEDN